MTDVNSTPPKSARKRIIFSRSPKDESSDSTLGHMSPLDSSSPDRYSSPPPSPQWLIETPPRQHEQQWLNESPFGPDHYKPEIRKSPRLSSRDKHAALTKQKWNFNGTPCKSDKDRKKNSKPTDIDMELVEETPVKECTNVSLLTPFKSLAEKGKKGEETPKPKSRRVGLVVGESPDKLSPPAPVKILQKSRPDIEVATVVKSDQTVKGLSKLVSVPTSSFYQSSRARASLFPEYFSRPKNRPTLPVVKSEKRKRSLSYESIHSNRHSESSLSSLRGYSNVKRRKLGEINVGVSHKIKKHQKKKSLGTKMYHPFDTAQPKITPEDRIESYLNKLELSTTDTPGLINVETGINTSTDGDYGKSSTSKNNENSSSVHSSSTVKTKPPPSPPPDPSKKFFKTRRTLKMNTSATVTVDKNIKLNVNNGKFTLSKPQVKCKAFKIPKVEIQTLSRENHAVAFEPIGNEKSTAEIVQENVHDDVEDLLRKLEESPQKITPAPNEIPVQSPTHNISALTSSLAISDDPLPLNLGAIEAQCADLSSGSGLENADTSHGELSCENISNGDGTIKHDAEKENGVKKYFPIFYQSPTNRKFIDVTNMRNSRGTKRHWKCIGDDQYLIDAGQKKFGATQCKECGVVYEIGDPDDEMSHQKYHDSLYNLKYSAWKNERVVAYFGLERIILIKPNDSKSWMNKVKDVLKIVDKELGYADTGLEVLENSQVFLYVTDKQVAGCVVAHPIKSAYKMLNSLIEGCDCCSEESYPAKCGISRVWVAENYRRKKIATRIIDCVRSTFIHGYVLGMDEFAFSAPTLAGKAFAEKYTGTINYLVYT